MDKDNKTVTVRIFQGDPNEVLSVTKNTLRKQYWKRSTEVEVRTCFDFGGEEGTNGEGYDFACLTCGFVCDLPEPNYCPHCGAKVID